MKLTAADLINWSWMSGQTLELWERKAIMKIDHIWMDRK
jgi:hypothetical protein